MSSYPRSVSRGSSRASPAHRRNFFALKEGSGRFALTSKSISTRFSLATGPSASSANWGLPRSPRLEVHGDQVKGARREGAVERRRPE